MARDIDRVLTDLAEVQDQLIALPDDAFAERVDLHTRQEALRAEAREARHATPDHLDAKALQNQIDYLERELTRYLDTRPAASVGGPSGGFGGGGIDPDKYHEMVEKMDKYVGYDELRIELQELRAELAQLETGE